MGGTETGTEENREPRSPHSVIYHARRGSPIVSSPPPALAPPAPTLRPPGASSAASRPRLSPLLLIPRHSNFPPPPPPPPPTLHSRRFADPSLYFPLPRSDLLVGFLHYRASYIPKYLIPLSGPLLSRFPLFSPRVLGTSPDAQYIHRI